MDLAEQLGVLGEEFLGDGLDAEGLLDFAPARGRLGVLEQVEKAGLRGVAAFAFADDVGETTGGREPGLHADLAGFLFDGGVFHLDVGEPPLRFRRRDERDECGVLFVAGLEMVGDEVADGGAGALQFGFVGQMDDQDIELLVVG